MANKPAYFVGQKIGCWTILESVGVGGDNYLRWAVKCSCGSVFEKSSHALRRMWNIPEHCRTCRPSYSNMKVVVHSKQKPCTISRAYPSLKEFTDDIDKVTCRSCKRMR